MKIDFDQLKKYNKDMAETIKKAAETDHIIHGYMIYRCEECHNIYVMWLEKGLEDPEDYKKTGKHKPVPFATICPACGGIIQHILWNVSKGSLSSNYRSYNEYVNRPNKIVYRNFFWNDPESDCGVSVIYEPDYFGNQAVVMYNHYITDIYFNTLPDEVREEVEGSARLLLDPELPLSPPSFDIRDLDGNRESRRRPNAHDRYKRPRSNKKLYEY